MQKRITVGLMEKGLFEGIHSNGLVVKSHPGPHLNEAIFAHIIEGVPILMIVALQGSHIMTLSQVYFFPCWPSLSVNEYM